MQHCSHGGVFFIVTKEKRIHSTAVAPSSRILLLRFKKCVKMMNSVCGIYALMTLIACCQGGVLNSTEMDRSSNDQDNSINFTSPSPPQSENVTEAPLITTDHPTAPPSENDSRIATINEDMLPYRNHPEGGITLTAPSTTIGDEDHYEDRDDYPPDWSVWASSWSTPPVVEEEVEPRRLIIEEEEEEGIPKVEERDEGDNPSMDEWYVLYMKGNNAALKSSLQRQDFIDDLKLNLASRLSLRYEELHLNHLSSSAGQEELIANFTIKSSSTDLIKRLSRLVSKDILTFSGEVFVLHRILKSDASAPPPQNDVLSHIHSYSHTSSTTSSNSGQDEQVELMLYLTIGGLCIFLFVLALSFLALQLVKSGSRNESDESDEDDEDWKLLLTVVNGRNAPPSSELESPHSHPGRSENHCDECEMERQQASKQRSRVMNSSAPSASSGSLSALGDWTSKFINSFRISGKYIDLNH